MFAGIGGNVRLTAAVGGVVSIFVGTITRLASAARVREAALKAKSPFVNL